MKLQFSCNNAISSNENQQNKIPSAAPFPLVKQSKKGALDALYSWRTKCHTTLE